MWIARPQVDTFNTRAETVGAPAESMHAVRGELKGTDAELDGRKFDLAIVRPKLITRRPVSP